MFLYGFCNDAGGWFLPLGCVSSEPSKRMWWEAFPSDTLGRFCDKCCLRLNVFLKLYFGDVQTFF